MKGSVKSVATRSCTYLECLTSLLMSVSVGVQKELVLPEKVDFKSIITHICLQYSFSGLLATDGV